jgi:hypothetical protein
MTAHSGQALVRTFVLLAVAGFLAHGCSATVVHMMDVASLVESSDLVVVGRIMSINSGGMVTLSPPGGSQEMARSFFASLRVDYTLKGSAEEGQLTFEFVIPQLPSGGYQAVPNGQYGIFLLRGEQSSYKPTDKTYPFLPAVRSFEPPPGSTLDRVISMLGRVVTTPEAGSPDRLRALEALRYVRGDFATRVLRQTMGASSGDLRLRIASALVSRNDLTGLEVVAAALLNRSGLSTYMVSLLGGSLAGLHDPRSVPVLSKLITYPNLEVRLGATRGLRQSHSASALAPLSIALGDANVWVRYNAVVGMGEITGQDEWTPAVPEFLQHQDKYLAHWRDWAQSNLPKRSL